MTASFTISSVWLLVPVMIIMVALLWVFWLLLTQLEWWILHRAYIRRATRKFDLTLQEAEEGFAAFRQSHGR